MPALTQPITPDSSSDSEPDESNKEPRKETGSRPGTADSQLGTPASKLDSRPGTAALWDAGINKGVQQALGIRYGYIGEPSEITSAASEISTNTEQLQSPSISTSQAHLQQETPQSQVSGDNDYSKVSKDKLIQEIGGEKVKEYVNRISKERDFTRKKIKSYKNFEELFSNYEEFEKDGIKKLYYYGKGSTPLSKNKDLNRFKS